MSGKSSTGLRQMAEGDAPTDKDEAGSAVHAGRFYLRYLSATGCFPVGGVWCGRRSALQFRGASFQVAYTMGIAIFVALYGYLRCHWSFVQHSKNDLQGLQTDQLVMASMTVTSPLMAIVNMVGMLLKAPRICRFLRRWGRWEREKGGAPSSYLMERGVLVIFMTMFIACVGQVLAPGAYHISGANITTLPIKVADGIFWTVSIPSITSPACLYSFFVLCIARTFRHLARDCENLPRAYAHKLQATWDARVRTTHDVRAVVQRYKGLDKLLEEANEVFSPLLLLTVVYFGVELCMFLYAAMVKLLFSYDTLQGLGVGVMYAVFFFLLLSFVTEAAQRAEDESSSCLNFLSALATGDELPEEELQILQVFLPIALARPPTCHGSNFFSINRKLLVAVLSATLTYIIILVQFKKSEGSRMRF